jgi:hypothetical protein
MRIRIIYRSAILLAIAGGLSPVHALTQEELVTKIQAAGYSQVSDVKSTAEGVIAKAVKNGKACDACARQYRPNQRAKLKVRE